MIASAPFDDWWHNAYGLDVKIISPPHMVLAAGMIGIQLGTMLLAVSWANRLPTPLQSSKPKLYLRLKVARYLSTSDSTKTSFRAINPKLYSRAFATTADILSLKAGRPGA